MSYRETPDLDALERERHGTWQEAASEATETTRQVRERRERYRALGKDRLRDAFAQELADTPGRTAEAQAAQAAESSGSLSFRL